jgi:type II secretory pathway pseudopilin PulG
MNIAPGKTRQRKVEVLAFTLMEVMFAIILSVAAFAGVILAYTLTIRRAEWSGYSLAAQALGIQQLEQARSAVWDPALGKNELLTLNLLAWTTNASGGSGYSWANLDLPISGTNATCATNFVTLKKIPSIGGAAGVDLYLLRVDTVWRGGFVSGQKNRLFTNSVGTYFAPDNRDVSTL